MPTEPPSDCWQTTGAPVAAQAGAAGEIVIRPGAPTDISMLIAVDLSAGELFTGTHMSWAVGQHTLPEQFAAAISASQLWVVTVSGVPAGYLLGDVLDGHFHIAELAIARPAQRRGLGRMLIDAALLAAHRRGHVAATLTTDRILPWNAPYYARLGFRCLAPESTPPQLAARLGAQPHAHLRCAMIRDLAPGVPAACAKMSDL